VRAFQAAHGLVVDGIVGPKTLAAGYGRTTQGTQSGTGVSAADWALVQQIASKYKIDPYILVAIGKHETGWGTQGAGRSGYTLGVGVPDSGGKVPRYQGLAAQLEGAAVILNRNGVHTIADVAAGKLAPSGGRVRYASDPNWTAAVVVVMLTPLGA